MKTQNSSPRFPKIARIALFGLILGLPATALAAPTTIFDANFNDATASTAVTTVGELGTPSAGTWSFVDAVHGGISTDVSGDKAAAFSFTDSAFPGMTIMPANGVAFGTSYPITKVLDASGSKPSALIASFANPGSFTGGDSTTINFKWGQVGLATSPSCKQAFVRGLDASGNEVFELVFTHLNPQTASQVFARGAADDSSTVTGTTGTGTPEGTLLISALPNTTHASPNLIEPAGLLGVTVTLENGQVTYAFSKGTASGNPLTYAVNSGATTISKLEFSATYNNTISTGKVGYWLDDVLVTKSDAITYSVTYDANTATSGTAPVDANSPYGVGSTVTVLGQGDLLRTGFSFGGWNTQADGLGTTYGATFTMPAANTTLYARWLAGTPSINANPTFPLAISTTYGTASSSTTVSISGSDLADDILATAPAGLEISSDGITYGSNATFITTGGDASGTLYARFANNTPAGSYDSQLVTITSPGVSDEVATTASGNSVATKTLTISAATALDKLFDGTTAATITGTLVGIENSDPVTLIGTGNFANATAGTWAVTANATLGGGSVTNNYTLTQPAGLTATITQSAIWTNPSGGTWNTAGNWLNNLIGSGSGTTSDFSTLDLPADTTVNLEFPVTVGNLVFADSETSTTPASWTLANNSTPANTLTLAGTTPTVTVDTLAAGKSVIISTAIAGSNGMIKSGAGTLTLSAVNTFTGGTTINAGTLVVGIDNIFGSGNGLPVVVNPSGTLDLNGKSLFISNFSSSGTIDNTSAIASTLNIGKNNTGGTISGIIQNTGGGALNLFKFGDTNTTNLTGLNTYTGVTKVLGGTLTFNSIANVSAGASALGAPTTIAAGTISLGNGNSSAGTVGALRYTGVSAATTDRVINLAGTTAGGTLNTVDGFGAITYTSDFTATGSGAKTLTLNGTSILASTVAGKIVDSSGGATSVFKNGVGTWILSADNPYTGTTTVSVGTLIVNGTHSTGGAYTVSTAGILSGTGTISASVAVTGIIAPGPEIGTLSTGPLSFNNQSTLAMDINTNTATADKIVVTGDVTRPGANVNLALNDLGSDVALPSGTKLTLVDYSGAWDPASTVLFNAVSVPNNSNIVLGANTFTLKYNDGTAMTLTAVNAATPYESWISGYAVQIPLAADRLPAADPDRDGKSNLVEFALNGNPASGSDNGKQMTSTADSADAGTSPELTLTIAVRDGAVLSAGPGGSATLTVDGIIYNVQGSLTLATPFASPVSEVSPFTMNPAPAAGWTARTFRLDASDGLPGKGFMRLSVSQ
ncbi:MAG: autotransporter-associated beta strand repeat-containing protein [Akkermansiaceae bacterium]